MTTAPEAERHVPVDHVVPTGSAVLDQHGAYLSIDDAACAMLRIEPPESIGSRCFAKLPVDLDEVWWLEERPEVTDAPLLCRLVRGEAGHRWDLGLWPAAASTARRLVVRGFERGALDAVTSLDREAMAAVLTDSLNGSCGFSSCFIVLIDEHTTDATFIGGRGTSRRDIVAMDECRRGGARMLIWEAFAQNLLIVDRNWQQRVSSDPQLAPIGMKVFDANFVAIPLSYAGRKVGVLHSLVRKSTVITPDRVGLWVELARETALALQYSDAIRMARASGSDRERQRLNEDLHDSVVQDVFALKMLAARAELDALEVRAPDLVERIGEVRSLSDKVYSGMRSMIGERRQVGEALPLSQQVYGLAREVGSQSGVDIQASVAEGWDHLSPECRDAVVRIVKEALRNISKHARARTAALRIVEDVTAPGMLLIEVVDDGESFDPEAASSASFGLTSIRERAAEHGGSVELRSAPSTTLRVRMRPTFESEWEAAVRHLPPS
jgi:signal transduction histidine kinase